MSDEPIDRRSVLKAAGASMAVGLGATTTAAARAGDGPADYAEPGAALEALSGHEDLLAALAADDLLAGASAERLVEDAEIVESGTARVEGVGETPSVTLTRSVEDGEVVVHALPERDVAFAIHRGEDGPTPYGVDATDKCPTPGCYWVCTWIQGCFCHCINL